jgi:hypothetical protein
VIPPKSKKAATARPIGDPLEFELAGQHLKFKDNISRIRLHYLAKRLHALGPKPQRGADLRDSLEQYAALPVDLIVPYGGDQFAPSLFSIEGGA